MSNPRINSDLFYVDGVPIPASYFQTIDTRQTAGLDGDAGGGTWNPSSAIQVGGAGMWACGPWTFAPPSSSTVQVVLTSTHPLTHGDSDYILLGSGHALSQRFVQTELSLGKDASGCPTLQTYTQLGGGQTAAVMGPTAVMSPIPPTNTTGFTTGSYGLANCPIATYPYRPGGRIVAPLSVHHGAQIGYVTFFFTISSAHSAQPENLPQFRVHKVDITGKLTPLNSTTTNGSGFLEMAWPGSVASYKTTTSYTYTCDGGTVIDTSTYSYFVEVIDESGTNSTTGNIFTAADAFYTLIQDMRPQ